MATISAKILKHHLKADGSYNVKIRIYHKNEKRYIDTNYFVRDKQLSKSLTIKDPFINKAINLEIDNYRIAIAELGDKLDFFNAEALRDYLVNKDKEIDFIEFCDEHVKNLKSIGREGTAANHLTVRNSLVDYFKRDKVSIMEITANMLKSYEGFLRKPRLIVRINQLKKAVTTKSKGVTDSGICNYMRDLRTLFNEATKKYNDEDLGIVKIPHYPFKKYKVPSPPITKKRNISIPVLRKLRDCETKPGSRSELAKELFMLSFYLCGMNAADLYYIDKDNVKKGRLDYKRKKTSSRRKDEAFISIKIVPEAKSILEKYIGTLSS